MKRRLILTATIAATAALAACGSGGDDTTDDTSADTSAAGSTQTVAVADVDGFGEVLVDSTGMALYTADEEADGEVRCVTACTSFWEPLAPGADAPSADPGVAALGVIERPDGTQQVTAEGRPLYTFVQDSPGSVTGDGFADDFGDQHLTWHAVRARRVRHRQASRPVIRAKAGIPITAGEIRSPIPIRIGGMWDASDEALLAGFASGDPDAAVVFVGRFQAKAFGLALAITGNRVDAEEVAQDAFVRAWRYAGSYDPRRGAVPAWLLGIVRNVALDRVRVSSRRRELPVESIPVALELEHVADSADGAGERDTVARIVASMRALPTEQRDAVLAVTLFGFTASELSAATGVPLGTVKTRIRLGLRKLRDQLGAQVR